jgi:hypothetical protein
MLVKAFTARELPHLVSTRDTRDRLDLVTGLLHTGGEPVRLSAGMSVLVGPGETHWFGNDSAGNFAFAEFWAPPPSGTVRTTAGDRCTWAPSS